MRTEWNRRTFVNAAATIAGAAAMAPLLTACGGGADRKTGTNTAKGLKAALPAHVPHTSVKPEIPSVAGGPDAATDPGFLTYPSPPVASVSGVPGKGGRHTAVTPLWDTAPTAENSFYQAMNKALGVELTTKPADGNNYATIVPTMTRPRTCRTGSSCRPGGTGFRERAERRGLRFLHRPCEGTYESTAGTLSRILGDRPDTTGFVVRNEAAIGPLLSLLRAGGRIVPEDAPLIALCPEPLADQHSPRLTSVTGLQKELGQAAVAQVLARITAVAEGGEPEDELRLMAPELVVRESTAPAPRRDSHR